jgi:hypothetical protein
MKFSHLDSKFKVRLVPNKPSIGLVIGTYGSPAYIHLFLEVAKAHFPVPILIHDDCSDKQCELKRLTGQYGCDFSSNNERYGHGSGDIAVFAEGLAWAKNKGLDILVKMSRRFIPLFDWRPSLIQTALKSQHITYTNHCEYFKFDFRSECVGMYVPEWSKYIEDLRTLATIPVEVEKDMMEFVSEFPKPTCVVNETYLRANYENKYCQQYGVWDTIGSNRMKINPQIIWHDHCQPASYLNKARVYGLKYDIKDFTYDI